MFKRKAPSTHHATNARWSKWITLITQRAHIGNPNSPGILEIITNWPEGESFGLSYEEEEEQVTWAKEAPPYNQGRDATYRWARDRGVDLTMDSVSQVIHDSETCAAIKQAKRVKPLWYGGQWSKYRYGEAWQVDYITLPQTRQGKHYMLTMVEATTGWLETYPVPHTTAWNTILGLEKQVLW
ncbi:hypothetical protein BTVI_70009 [Pitangus sulphuratus]|nr:hypothetical protein BTVI_70009 [Pitangus sulphuratus]